MQQLLTKGIGHTTFKDSSLGEIPESWEIKRLDNICDRITDGSHFSPQPQKDTGWLIATVKDMAAGTFNLATCANISKENFDMLVRNGCSPLINDIVYSKDGTIGKTFVFNEAYNIVLLSSIAIITPISSHVDSNYLCQFLKSHYIAKQLEGLTSGSAIRRLVLRAIKEMKVALPPLSEQKTIASILLALDEKQEVLRLKKSTYQDFKKGLMQQLLTGKIRVKSLIENEMYA